MNSSDPLLFTNESEGNEAAFQLQIKESGSKYKNSKCDNIEQIITVGSQMCISYLKSIKGYSVMIKDVEGTDILGPFTIKLGEMGFNPASVEQEIINVQREIIAPNVDVRMPRLNGEKGLHLFFCPVAECMEIHVRTTSAKLHALSHMKLKPYACDHPGCNWSFYTMPKLTRHKDTHLKRKDYECTEPGCGKRFTTMYNYKEHKKKHELPAIIECPVKTCLEKFQNYKARNEHVKTHKRSEAAFVCPVPNCNKRFFNSVTLQGHSRSHSHDPENLTCRICNKVFNLPCRLRDHLIHHTGERPHICSLCHKGFRSSSKLKRHIATHTNDRKYQCTVCDKKFLRSECLKDHMDTHGSSLTSCKVCFEYFPKDEINQHMQDNHTEKKLTLTDSPSLAEPTTSGDLLLEQAIQSLGVPSDIMLSSYIEEPTLDFLDSVDNESFSTVNLRDFGINV